MSFKSKGIVVLKRPFPQDGHGKEAVLGLNLVLPWLFWKDSVDGGVEVLSLRLVRKARLQILSEVDNVVF